MACRPPPPPPWLRPEQQRDPELYVLRVLALARDFLEREGVDCSYLSWVPATSSLPSPTAPYWAGPQVDPPPLAADKLGPLSTGQTDLIYR